MLTVVGVVAAIAFKQGRDARAGMPKSTPAAQVVQSSRDSSRPTVPATPAVTVVDSVSRLALDAKRDIATIQERLREGSPGTYIMHMLIGKGDMLQRWPDRTNEPLRVWIQPAAAIPDWSPTYPVVAEAAFDEWRRAGFPIRFDMIRDSTGADIRIQFVQQMPREDSLRIGVTVLQYDQGGTIHRGEIMIATHDFQGRAISPDFIAGTARHEVGHVLGLGHSYRTNDVMFPESRTPVISDFDRATLHLLYLLPPGRVK